MTRWRSIWIAALIGVLLFVLKTTTTDNIQTSIKTERFAGGIASGARTPLEAVFRNGITLLGVTTPESAASGAEVRLQAFWTVQDTIENNYSALYRLVNADGQTITETRRYEPGFVATENWVPDLYVEDVPTLDIPPYTPPGTYMLQAALYDAETGASVDVMDAAGNPAGVYLPLTTLTITRPESQPASSVSPIPGQETSPLQILDVNDLPSTAQVGNALASSWLWQTTAALENDYMARLVWLLPDNDSGTIAATTQATAPTLYPTTQWQAGDIWRGQPRLFVPGTLAAGEYMVGVQYDADVISEESPLVEVASMNVTTPERHYTLPQTAIESDVTWQNGIQLAGYNLFTDTSVTEVTLYWATMEPLRESLRYYVHVLLADENSPQIVAQDDAIPVEWTRPTTGWDTGEIITTVHRFPDLARGAYHVRVGWYEPRSDERIRLGSRDTDDGYTLPLTIRIPPQKIPKTPK